MNTIIPPSYMNNKFISYDANNEYINIMCVHGSLFLYTTCFKNDRSILLSDQSDIKVIHHN